MAAAAALLAGCGGSDGIAAALGRSPLTYWHYRDAAWWGRDPHIRFVLERRRGAWAIAELQAPTGKQWVLLHDRGGWRVVSQTADHGARLYCGAAPRGVVRGLVGACTRLDESWDLTIVGPTDRRAPTPAERRAILKPVPHCTRPRVVVSRLDPTYAELDNCAASGGAFLFHRTAKGWREAGLEVDGFACREAPPGVIRSVHGRCLLAG